MKIQTYSPKDQTIKCLIYGASGSGKTTFSASAPNPIFASSEKGLMSIRQYAPAYTEINSL
jgi:GTPase SAR1 family protein